MRGKQRRESIRHGCDLRIVKAAGEIAGRSRFLDHQVVKRHRIAAIRRFCWTSFHAERAQRKPTCDVLVSIGWG